MGKKNTLKIVKKKSAIKQSKAIKKHGNIK